MSVANNNSDWGVVQNHLNLDAKSQEVKQNNNSKWSVDVGVSSVVNLTEMIDKNAEFYYNDEKVTNEKAIQVVKSKSPFRIKTVDKDTKHPKVYIWDAE